LIVVTKRQRQGRIRSAERAMPTYPNFIVEGHEPSFSLIVRTPGV
jgi:hypothetical protein